MCDVGMVPTGVLEPAPEAGDIANACDRAPRVLNGCLHVDDGGNEIFLAGPWGVEALDVWASGDGGHGPRSTCMVLASPVHTFVAVDFSEEDRRGVDPLHPKGPEVAGLRKVEQVHNLAREEGELGATDLGPRQTGWRR